MTPTFYQKRTHYQVKEKMSDLENHVRHVIGVEETPDSVIIEYAKAHDDEEMEMEENAHYDEDEEEDRGIDATFYRSVRLRKDDKDKTRFNVAFVSEEPVLREFGYEIIDQARMDTSFLESGRAPVLFMHDAERVLGVVESVKRDGDLKSRAVIRLGTSTQLQRETLEQIRNGILSNISIGYSIRSMDEQEEKIEGRSVYRVATRIMEISLVSVPADSTVGINRGAKVIQEPSKQEVKTMENTEAVEQVSARDIEKALAERSKTNKEILALAARHNKRDLADEAIGRNTSLEEFRGILLEHIESKPLDSAAEPVQKPVEEKRTYSLLRALNAASRGDWSGAGFEAEMNQEVALKRGKQPQGFYIPDFAWRDYDPAMKRELTVGTNASGGFFAPSVQLADEFVEALRARMVLPGLGMRIMSGLNTKIQIPKISAGAAAAFVAESGDVGDQTQTTAQITMVGRTLGARTDVSRLLLLESDPSIEQIVRDDLLAAVANKIEDVAIEGGASNEPTGITQTSGIGSVAIGTNGGAPTWAMVTNLVKEVEIDNAAINGDTLAFLTNPKVKSKMANTVRVASTDSHMILNDPYNNLYGYDIGVTTNVPSDLTKGSTSGSCSALIFGDFSQLMMGVFGGGPDVLIDPYTNSASGSVRIVVHQEIDVAVRHAQSFAACLDLTT
jgi:HK97 family phage major capsid protein/HK97 family phage prohead protease